LVRDLGAAYVAFAAGAPPPPGSGSVTYVDYAVWQRGWLRGERLEAQLSYWRAQLAGSPPLLELPTDRPRPAVQQYQAGDVDVRFDPEVWSRVQALCRRA